MQGVFESIVPLLVAHLMAGYTRNWFIFQNLAVLWLVYVLSYFEFDWDYDYDPDDDDSPLPI